MKQRKIEVDISYTYMRTHACARPRMKFSWNELIYRYPREHAANFDNGFAICPARRYIPQPYTHYTLELIIHIINRVHQADNIGMYRSAATVVCCSYVLLGLGLTKCSLHVSLLPSFFYLKFASKEIYLYKINRLTFRAGYWNFDSSKNLSC